MARLSDPYLEALDELAEAVQAHRATYAALKRGLATWDATCETTWTCVLGRVRIAGFVSGAGVEMPVVTFEEPDNED